MACCIRDGIYFKRAVRLDFVRTGCGPYDSDALADTFYGHGISWGVAQEPGDDRVYVYIVRLEVDRAAPQPT